MPTAPSANGPVSTGIPTASAKLPAGPERFGPRTAPIVVAHTTVDRARARRSSVARSVAAYRAPLFDAVPAPTSAAPTSRSSIEPMTPAATASRLPTAATR